MYNTCDQKKILYVAIMSSGVREGDRTDRARTSPSDTKSFSIIKIIKDLPQTVIATLSNAGGCGHIMQGVP